MARALIIHNDQELLAAIDRADELMDCAPGSAEALELAVLSDAIDEYVEDVRRRMAGEAHNDNFHPTS